MNVVFVKEGRKGGRCSIFPLQINYFTKKKNKIYSTMQNRYLFKFINYRTIRFLYLPSFSLILATFLEVTATSGSSPPPRANGSGTHQRHKSYPPLTRQEVHHQRRIEVPRKSRPSWRESLGIRRVLLVSTEVESIIHEHPSQLKAPL